MHTVKQKERLNIVRLKLGKRIGGRGIKKTPPNAKDFFAKLKAQASPIALALFLGAVSPAHADNIVAYSDNGDEGVLAQVQASHQVAPILAEGALILEEGEAVRGPLVIQDDEGELRVSQWIQGMQETLLDMNELAYSLVKGGGPHLEISTDLAERLQEAGWRFKLFLGLEGSQSQHLDVAGLVAYHPGKSLINVVYHGTATIDDGIRAGWETNFDGRSINAQGDGVDIPSMLEGNEGLNLPGRIHRGFAKKYVSTKPQMLGLLREYIKQMDAEQRDDLRIIFTGHSQAGAVGNIALHDVALNHGEEFFGDGFDNQLQSRLYGYFLSVPRTGDEAYVESLHESVGRSNILRQNVHGDLVPVLLGNKFLGKMAGKVSSFVRDIARYEDSGYLLLERGGDVWRRANTEELRRGRRAHTQQALAGIVIDELSAIQYTANPLTLAREIRDEVAQARGIWKATGFCKALVKGVAKRALKLVAPIPKGLISIVGDHVWARFAHYHYGYDARDGREAVFASHLVGRDLEALLENGQEREA